VRAIAHESSINLRRTSNTIARAAAGVSASAVRWPIFRPRRASVLPYRCSFDLRLSQHRSPIRRLPVRPAQPQIAQQVCHRRRPVIPRIPQRQPAHRAQLLLKLARRARFNRQMPRVMRPWRKLIHQQPPVAREEQLDTEDAHQLKPLHHRPRHRHRFRRHLIGHPGGRRRHVQDMVRVLVGHHPVMREAAILPPRRHHRQLLGKRHKPFQHRRLTPDRRPGCCRRPAIRAIQINLSLAVIARRRRLQDRRRPNSCQSLFQLGKALHRCVRRRRQPLAAEEHLLPPPVLRDVQRPRVRPQRRKFRARRRRRRRHVLKLIRHHVHSPG
jgi:hypothetical protein